MKREERGGGIEELIRGSVWQEKEKRLFEYVK
jgi:hypothetical protein